MVYRYGKQDGNTGTKRRVGRLTPVQDMYEGTPIWERTDPVTQAAIAGFDAGDFVAGNNGKWDAINMAAIGAKNRIYEENKNNAPPSSGGGNSNKALMGALTQYANNMGSNTGVDSINNLYNQLLTDTRSSGQSQQDSINTFYNKLFTDTSASGQSQQDSINSFYNQLLNDTKASGQSQEDAIKRLYGTLLGDTTDRGKSQQDAINQFYGGAETQLGGLNADALAMLQNQYNQISGEIGTQSDAGRATIDESTQRALAALGGQSNPYAGLQMADIGAVTDPMAAYSQAVGTPQGGIDALQQMLQSQNAATRGGFGNLAQLLGASQQAAQQSRIGDVNVARAGAQQDLAANQRAAALRALQQSQQAQQAQQGTYAQQMLGLGQNRLQSNLGAEQSMNDMLNQLQQNQLNASLGSQQNTGNLLSQFGQNQLNAQLGTQQNMSGLLSQLAQSQLQSQLGSQQNTGSLLSQLQQGQLNSQLGQQQNNQGRRNDFMDQLLGLAGQGIDVSQIIALLGGQ